MPELTLKPGWATRDAIYPPCTAVPVPLTATVTWNPPYQAMPQQGWQCPVCKNIYAPFMPQCSKCCNQGTATTTTASSIPEKP